MTDISLTGLGWSNTFRAQLTEDDTGSPARISAVARDRVTALTPEGPLGLVPGGMSTGEIAVGDWVLTDGARVLRVLERQTLIQRRAAGERAARQLIAANVDTLGIVTSCNADFNVARLERYLALAAASGCLPLVILTKADLASDPRDYARRAERLSPLVSAIALDARDPGAAELLQPWCRAGQTLALVGSSGVGKTTLTNTLTGRHDATRGIREDDARGRHTTTARALLPMVSGGWLIDTPGMRELGLTEAAEGIGEVFSDIAALAAACRFSDCAHETEPGCAVTAAIAAGELDPERLKRWRKLLREDARSTETIAEARARGKAFARHVAAVTKDHRRRKGDV
ncbi:ribosome small subunit-dependent GTPase A [Psychromarinibacter sp. C21-152]|uniref:Small ribosomal subunit biogenesis GTPase RsgA n=1 Tax=Psychromarinibacter sediminicola TaxID=3033385 RepID=A0AAE3NTR4_9RHOB|nr:ribosome small subunit-dependent GTPase A [Psychromarinibacter sediminicola]MDF0600765.1 ribosome small subunit-dependent GTPase A [Psychromarinibacter sediminicola]